jgi:multiple sugar transport system ATP-binding protein
MSGIVKSFGQTAVLKGVSLDIADGEFVSLVGPSGCGKTTLLRIIAGLETQDAGDVFIGDVMVDDLPPKARDIAMVFQSYALYPYISVAQNMALPLTMRRLSFVQRLPGMARLLPVARRTTAEIAAHVQAVAESLSIAHLLGRKPGQLSGGQRQRVALGRAMVRNPAAFLMDEPLSNLDAKLRVQARAEISDLHRKLGGTFIYVTHDQVEAMTMSDRVAVMMDGELLQVDRPRALYAEPASLRVAEFIGTPKINVIDARLGEHGALSLLGERLPVQVDGAPGTPVRIGIRPEAIAITGDGLPARVHHMEYLGADAFLHAAVIGLDAPLTVRIDPDAHANVQVGALIGLSLARSRPFVFGEAGQRLPTRMLQSMPMHDRVG